MYISEKIIPYLNDLNRDKLMSQEDMIFFFNDDYFDGISAIIINGYGDNDLIIPTLSFSFSKIGPIFDFSQFSALKNIYEFIETELYYRPDKQFRNLAELAGNLQTGENFFFDYNHESQILVISNSKRLFNLPDYGVVTTFLFLCKRNSLNLLNSSYDYTIEDLKVIGAEFSKSIAETAKGFKRFFERAYSKLNVTSYSKNYENNTWYIDNEDIDKGPFVDLKSHVKLIDYNKPIYLKEGKTYVLILPFCNDKRSYFVKHILVVKSRERIPKYIVTNYLKFVNNYFNAYLEKQKRSVLNSLQLKIIAIQNEQQYITSQTNPLDELKPFVKKAFDDVVILTNAFSATLRLYNPGTRSLDLVVESIENSEVIGDVSEEKRKSILLSSFKSINVQTFKTIDYQSEKPYLYIKDTENRGLRFRNSHSELCLPLFFKCITIGVVNFESPNKNGFDLDTIGYLSEIRNLIQNFYIHLLEINDKLWLSRRTQIYQNYHEIDNIINSDLFPLEFKKEIQPLIQKQHISIGEQYDTFSKLTKYKNEYFSQLKTEMPRAAYSNFNKRIVNLIEDNVLELPIRKYVIDSLLIIYKNILTNQRKYAPGQYDKVYTLISETVIKFSAISSRPLLYENSRNYLISPFITESKGSEKVTHYGLFIIGMLTRQLGGYPYIFFNDKNSRTHLNITIPLQKLWKKTPSKS